MTRGKHLFIVNDFPPILGGQSAFLYALCRALPPEQIVVMAPERGDTRAFDQAQPFTIVRKPYLVPVPLLEKLVKIVLPLWWVQPLLRREPVALVHCAHVLSTGFIGLTLKALLELDYVLYIHSADVMEHENNPFVRPWLDRILANARHVVCSSHFTRDHLLELGVAREKMIVSLPRLDPSEFEPRIDEGLLRQHGLAGRRIILSINRLVERKGNDVVLRALPDLLRRSPDVVYVIFGRGPYENRLRVLARQLGVEASVVFISGNDTVRRTLLSACEVFVMISRRIKERGDAEGFGIVYLEAGACGKPVVAGNSGGVPDAVEDGVNGFLVDPLDPSATAKTVMRLLEDKALARDMGGRGHVRVMERFDYRRGVPELDPIFQEAKNDRK